MAIRTIEADTEQLIETLDALEERDCEPKGDELDGNLSEDDFMEHRCFEPGPGCPISNPDSAVDDRNCDDINMDLEPEGGC